MDERLLTQPGPARVDVPTPFRLDGRCAIVTGASAGLGVAMAHVLGAAGADLVLTGRRADELDRTQHMIVAAGGRALCVTGDAAYSASKAGIEGLTRDLARQWTGRKGIRVNSVAPGFFATRMTADFAPKFLTPILDRILVGRFGESAELAHAVLFLASDASSYISGQCLVVDGGMTVS